MRKFASTGVGPPSQALISRTEELARQLGADLAHRQQYSAILASVTGFVSAWASLSPQAAAGTAARAAGAAHSMRGAEPATAKTSNLAFIGQA